MAKLAVIQTGGKQYLVEEGTIVDIEKLEGQDGKIEFAEVLMIDDGKAVKLGTPTIEGAKVTGEIMEQFRDDKVTVIKMHRRKRYRRKQGHRQDLTKVKIVKIT
jgi:large subunit ribosomal protein L21